jgi:riboflavin kinase/FMN adenylyltransferase
MGSVIRAIAIGSFDGLHSAHMKLIEQVDGVIIIERGGGYLTPGYKRSCFTHKTCFFYHFEKIQTLSPEAFVKRLQQDFPYLEKIVVGYDFGFGAKKVGNTTLLKEIFDGEVVVVNEVQLEGVSVHSRTIKHYLQEGNVEVANKLLGRVYEVEGAIVSGQGLGKKELVATMNLEVEHYQLPKEGVYATKTNVDGVWYDSVSFIGHRVTTDGLFAVETHILNREIEVHHPYSKIAFYGFIRENQKFHDLTELKAQIEDDIKKAYTLLEKASIFT